MKKSLLCIMTSCMTLPMMAHADSPYFSLKDGDGFKRFSVSAGWLHAMPQGNANPIKVNTAVAEGTQSKVGDISKKAVLDAAVKESNPFLYGAIGLLGNTIPSALTGTATVNGLSSWTSEGTGLTAKDVDTFGLMGNYYFTDNLSLEFKAGIPPKVEIEGKGQIYAPLTGKDSTPLGSIDLKKDIAITDLTKQSKAASATAWLPAAELHYQFGKSGVNKLRPYIGVGVMYAHFTHLKVDNAVKDDLIAAGHMIQNVLDGQAGAALDSKKSSANPVVKVEADDAWAPMATLGATYDFNDRWFGVGSVTYAPMSSDATITISDSNTNKQLVTAKTKIDIDPLITYVGVGYRF